MECIKPLPLILSIIASLLVGDRNPAVPVPSKAREPRLRQKRLKGTAPEVINARIDRAGTDHLDPEWRVKPAAIELPQHQGEVGALGVPGGLEVRPELDLGRAMGPARRELPSSCGWFFEAKLGYLVLQPDRGLLERERPVVEHVLVARARNPARDAIEVGVLIRMQPGHLDDRRSNANRKQRNGNGRNRAARPCTLEQ